MTAATLIVDHVDLDGAVVLRPVGVLDASTYVVLRDTVLKHAAQQPSAVIIDLDGLQVPAITSLALFPAVWRLISSWPAVPLMLSASRSPLPGMLQAASVSRFVPTFGSVDDAVAAIGTRARRRRAELPLTADVGEARFARAWVRSVLDEWQLVSPGPTADAWEDDVVLVASELVENGATHARSSTLLRLERHPHGLSVAVSDGDPRPPFRVPFAEATSEGGRGLAVVAELAVVWGHHPALGTGKVVWAVLAVPGDG